MTRCSGRFLGICLSRRSCSSTASPSGCIWGQPRAAVLAAWGVLADGHKVLLQLASCLAVLAHMLRDDIAATYGAAMLSALACLQDDFEACIAHLRFRSGWLLGWV
jgi:hypothetical protein